MNGIPNVPITTLAGVASLTDLLPELPLPTPLPSTVTNKSLLFHPRLAEEAKRALKIRDDSIVTQLSKALAQTSTDHIELKDPLASDGIEGDVPDLLRSVLQCKPDAFRAKKGVDGVDSTSVPAASPAAGVSPRQMVPPAYPPAPSTQQSPYQTQYSPYPTPKTPSTPNSPGRAPAGPTPSPKYNQHGSPYSGSHGGPLGGGHGASQMTAPLVSPPAPVNGTLAASSSNSSPASQKSGGNMSPPRHKAPAHAKQSTVSSSPASVKAPAPIPSSRHEVNAITQLTPPADVIKADVKATSVTSSSRTSAAVNSHNGHEPVKRMEPVVLLEPLNMEFKWKTCKLPPTERPKALSAMQSRPAPKPVPPATPPKPQKPEKPEKPEKLEKPEKPVSLTEKIKASTPQIRLLRIEDHFEELAKVKKKGRGSGDASELSLKLNKQRLNDLQHSYNAIDKDGRKRRRSYSDDPPSPVSYHQRIGEYSLSLSERVKRRRRETQPERDDDDDKYSIQRSNIPQVPKEKDKDKERRRRKERERLARLDMHLTMEERTGTGSFRRFQGQLDNLFELIEDGDVGAVHIEGDPHRNKHKSKSKSNTVTGEDEDLDVPSELLVGRSAMADLANEAAKLKSIGVLNLISTEKLVRLQNVLLWNIRDACKVLPNISQLDESDDDDDEVRSWREMAAERVIRSTEAALLALYVMTSENMPKQVYNEDVIEKACHLAKFQLINSIYPEYDPVYKVSTHKKDAYTSSKQKRARAGAVKHKSVILLYNKLTELVGLLAELVSIQELTDTVILLISSLGVAPFFVENVSELQLSAIRLVTTIFSKYEKHRALIMEDIFASLARLPSTKRNLRSYRLNSEDSIQMVTALVLQLIQSVVKLPNLEEQDEDDPDKKKELNLRDEKTTRQHLADNEVSIVTSYEKSALAAHNFLAVYLKKCTLKGEEDYRPLFENFIQDLLSTVNKPEWPAAELLLSLLGRLLVQHFSNKSVDMSVRVASLDYLGIVAARLRKDALSSHMNQEIIDEILQEVQSDDLDSSTVGKQQKKNPHEFPYEKFQDLMMKIAPQRFTPPQKTATNVLREAREREALAEKDYLLNSAEKKKTVAETNKSRKRKGKQLRVADQNVGDSKKDEVELVNAVPDIVKKAETGKRGQKKTSEDEKQEKENEPGPSKKGQKRTRSSTRDQPAAVEVVKPEEKPKKELEAAEPEKVIGQTKTRGNSRVAQPVVEITEPKAQRAKRGQKAANAEEVKPTRGRPKEMGEADETTKPEPVTRRGRSKSTTDNKSEPKEKKAKYDDSSEKKTGKKKTGKKGKGKKKKEEEEEVEPRFFQMDDKDPTQLLQKALIDYLTTNARSDPVYHFARQFYISQWYRDSNAEAARAVQSSKKLKSKNRSDSDQSGSDSDDEKTPEQQELAKSRQVLQRSEKRKLFLISQLQILSSRLSKDIATTLDHENACLCVRFLAANRPFSHSFDIYLTQILKVLSETSVAVRTKAMKCLTAVVEVDPAILARDDMQHGVHGRFLDQSTSVREAAVELVGKFILVRPELTATYYQMLSERILDTGISVRKRVIKIFRDICLEQPEFDKIPEMCVRMIRRVNDEEGIKKLVTEVFQTMWFTPVRQKENPQALLRKVLNIADVVSASRDSGWEWLEQLLEGLLRKEEELHHKPVETSCRQIVNCLVENVLKLEERSADTQRSSSPRLVSCLTTLYLLCKVKPNLMTEHAMTLQPYLEIKCNTTSDQYIIYYTARILELTIPLLEHPSQSFLAQLEEDMMKLILQQTATVLQSCVSCLGAIINQVSRNYQLVKDCFRKLYGILTRLVSEHTKDPNSPVLAQAKPTLLRSLFTIGLLCCHFDFDGKEMQAADVSPSAPKFRDRVFDVLMYFTTHEDEVVEMKSLTGLGFMCETHYDYMLGSRLKEYYIHVLTWHQSVRLKCQVLKNLLNYLVEEEAKMIKADHEWRKTAEKEDLKEMGDIQSGMASTVMQVYLKEVLESFFSPAAQVRSMALAVICLVLKQGLVHPVQCVPYLIAMGTDTDLKNRTKADQQLQEIDRKYPGFIHMKALSGIKMSYRLQCVLQEAQYNDSLSKAKNEEEVPFPIVRGSRTDDHQNASALNTFLYSLVRNSRQHRRALISSLLKLFDEDAKTSLAELLYLSDNLACFNYSCADEPLFIMHQIDIIVSVSGSNIIQSFRELFFPEKVNENGEIHELEDEDEDNIDILTDRVDPERADMFHELCKLSQGCILLLVIKHHLKDIYSLTDSKIHRYSPNDSSKLYDKQTSRRTTAPFDPKQTLEVLRRDIPDEVDQATKRLLAEEYLDFKYLMMSIDPADEDEEDGEKASGTPGQGTPAGSRTPLGPGAPDQEAQGAPGAPAEASSDPGASSVSIPPSAPPPNKVAKLAPPVYVSKHSYLLEKRRSPAASRSRPPQSRADRTVHSSAAKQKHLALVKKKKKRKKRVSDSESAGDDSDDGSDPDWR